MTTVFKKLAIGGKASFYQAVKTYRPGSVEGCVRPAITKLSIGDALNSSKTKVTFLQTETLKGLPVDTAATTKTIDPYLACYIRDLDAAYFGK
mmetsp:Transcript_32142/g.93915  ORF Transcript_32142/g.93915 Transcript_32142/m.93915 type:complete len:93 (-) Transcript_32142:96-374(-)